MRTPSLFVSAATGLTAAALTATALSTTTATAATAPQPAGHRASPFEVSIKASTDELVLGEKVTLRGAVSPKVKGKKVVLEQKVGDNGWKPTGSATTNKRGRYEVSDKPTTLNPRTYRVVKPATGRHKQGISKKVAVSIYRWHRVYDLQSRDSESMYRVTSLSIDTVGFPKSLAGSYYDAANPTGFIDYNIERQCIRLKATYGMSDDADTDSSVKIDVLGDGAELYTGTFALLESQQKTLDLHGVFRLAFDFTSLTDTHAVAAVGSPEVLCSF